MEPLNFVQPILLTKYNARYPRQRQSGEITILADQKVEDEIVDTECFASKVLEQIEIGPARLIQGHNLTSNHGAIREIAQCFDNVRILVIEGFVPPRE